MPIVSNAQTKAGVVSHARILNHSPGDYDELMQQIGDARFVLLGESSHGTQEFYRERARITQRLIEEKGFAAVAVEADWPDAYRVNRYVRGIGNDASSARALSGFARFPTWMWRNTEVVRLLDWMRARNAALPPQAVKAGFYGLDLYSLFKSIDAVLLYLQDVDPEAAKRAKARYACFDHYQEDSQRYGYAAAFGMSASCEQAVLEQLRDMHLRQAEPGEGADADEFFYAHRNAILVKNAEEYYRSMFRGRVSSWNLRDSHMSDTLDALAEHLSQPGRPAKIVVWEHNSHIGDARATEMGQQGEWNVGQLTRENYGNDAYLVGFTTHHGTVTAATDWGEPAERRRVRPGLAGSYEALFHQTGIPAFMLLLRGNGELENLLSQPRLERAIGVIYRPESERQSHYFHASLPRQFDAVIHIDETRALEPLERTSLWETGEPTETYPFGV